MTSSKPAIHKGAYHHGDLKDALKKAALRLVRQKGPEGFSLNEASRQAGVTVAAPYRHFEDKNALLAEIACDGCELMVHELNEAAASVSGTKAKMLEAGMAYLRFASVHADYFAVIFNSGLDKSKYPELERAAGEAFGVILGLSQQAERTAGLAMLRALSAWALVHGLATLAADGALSMAMPESSELEHLRLVLREFLGQPYGASAVARPASEPRTGIPT
jgi:AcrR family transcriptional regulator